MLKIWSNNDIVIVCPILDLHLRCRHTSVSYLILYGIACRHPHALLWQGSRHDGLYIRPTLRVENDKKYRFSYPFHAPIRVAKLWHTLESALTSCIPDKPQYVAKLWEIQENASISFTYGPSMRDLLDNHGYIIRTAGAPADIHAALMQCRCARTFPRYVDEAIGHVRTNDTNIIRDFRHELKHGLNHRPRVTMSLDENVTAAAIWAESAIRAFRSTIIRGHAERILRRFKSLTRQEYYRAQRANAPFAHKLYSQAEKYKHTLAVFSTDKVANTPSIECIHHYRWVCLQRLQSSAFRRIPTHAVPAFELELLAQVQRLTPWAAGADFTPAILFATTKRHKDPVAYRYITSDCSGYTKPISDEVVRVLTPLMQLVREHCIGLQAEHGAKFWWAIDSLDILPLNLDLNPRPARQLEAYDLDKCFECIPLIDGEHALMNHLEQFLEIAFGSTPEAVDALLTSKFAYTGLPRKEVFWAPVSNWSVKNVQYGKTEIIDLVKTLLSMTYITVGDYAAQQHVGIPMGLSASVILLNIYAFVPEFLFVWRLLRLCPELAPNTKEIFRYVDDLGNVSDLDLRPFMEPESPRTPDNIYWIYPLAPFGPLSMSDQTDRRPDSTQAIYLNTTLTLTQGVLHFELFEKHTQYSFTTCRLTHWSSHVSVGSKKGLISMMTRTALLTACTPRGLARNMRRLISTFKHIGFPRQVVKEQLGAAFSAHVQRLPPQHICRLFPK
jgi:hypothetical protein